MARPGPGEDVSFVSIEERLVPRAVERLKGSLPEAPRECASCGYVAATHRWGIVTLPAADHGRVALVLCCPGCERPSDLPPVEGRDGV